MSWKMSSFFSYSVLTDQQSHVQATNKVYHKSTIVSIIIKLNNCKYLMCVLLGFFGFLFFVKFESKMFVFLLSESLIKSC